MYRKIHFVVEGEKVEVEILDSLLLKLNFEFINKKVFKQYHFKNIYRNEEKKIEVTVEKTIHSQIKELLNEIENNGDCIELEKFFKVAPSSFYFIFDVDQLTSKEIKSCTEFIYNIDDGYLLLNSPCVESLIDNRCLSEKKFEGVPRDYKSICTKYFNHNFAKNTRLTSYINNNIIQLLIYSICNNIVTLNYHSCSPEYVNEIYDHPHCLYTILDTRITRLVPSKRDPSKCVRNISYNIIFSTLYVAVAEIFNLKSNGSNNYAETLIEELKKYL